LPSKTISALSMMFHCMIVGAVDMKSF